MPRPEHALTLPARMTRVAIVAPAATLRDALAAVADAGTVELSGTPPTGNGEALEALRRLQHLGANGGAAALAAEAPDVAELERRRQTALLAGEVELGRRVAAAVEHGSFAAVVGWTPRSELEPLAARLAPLGATAIELPRPRWLDPPTLIARERVTAPFRPLVETYGPARYADLDPTLFTVVSFVLMFGMMFGDVGHGLLVALLALLVRRTRSPRFATARRMWTLPFAAGLSAALFGLLYGECFGPTGLVPRLWLDPVEEPTPLLAAAVAVGAVLLAQSYAFGTVNRWREEGAAAAIVSPTGVAGTTVFVGAAVAAAGWYFHADVALAAGAVLAVAGVALMAVGYALASEGRGAERAVQVVVETTDGVVRIGAGTISFTRLAAFGLVHAALGAVVWEAAAGSWPPLAIAVFLIGNAVTFSLELLVATIQALRLEYYELFSHIFAGQGRAFAPWHIPLAKEES